LWPSDKSAAVNITNIDLRRFEIMIRSRRRSAWEVFSREFHSTATSSIQNHDSEPTPVGLERFSAANFIRRLPRRFKTMIWSRRRSAWGGFQPRISFDGTDGVIPTAALPSLSRLKKHRLRRMQGIPHVAQLLASHATLENQSMPMIDSFLNRLVPLNSSSESKGRNYVRSLSQ